MGEYFYIVFPNNSSRTGVEPWNVPNDVGDTEPPRETSESGRSMFGEKARADDGVALESPDSESESNSVL